MKLLGNSLFTLLLLVVTLMGLTIAQTQASNAPEKGKVTGVVIDINEGRVADADVMVEGVGISFKFDTHNAGEYKVELPPGRYRITVSARGFCRARRAPFLVEPSATIQLNFTLTVCPLVNEVAMAKGKITGEVHRYRDPFKEEVFPLTAAVGAPLEILVRYGARLEEGNTIQYERATLSYNLLLIRADKIRLNRKTFRVEAEGNVLVEDGSRSVSVKRAVADLQSGEPKLDLTP